MTTKRGRGVIFVDNDPKGFELSCVIVLVLVFSVSFRLTLAIIAMLNFVVSDEMVGNGDFALFLEDGTKLKMTVMRQSVNSHNFNLP